ncbi:hypothetical protein [Robbsia andropogonis]|uniref:hypothetical protein n=1 Tax=Robbsia andropogonis TaxID=28092 RepID=UPI002A6AAEF9|nr:hypothetical protein [Robbsia andropogonis]
MNNKQLAQALRAIRIAALPIKDRAAVLNAAEALEIGEAQPVTDERNGFDVALNALAEFERNWDTGAEHPYAEMSRIEMEGACEAVRGALNEARAARAAAAGDEKRDAEEFPRFTLSGHELLAALDFIAPDRDTPEHADQLDGEVTIQYGDGHTGKGYYAWCTDYADEGSVFLSTPAEGAPAPAIAAASKGDGQ